MVLQIPENMQLLLGSSADSKADLPQQAFALTLSDDVLEGMIESVRNGQGIQLSLGNTPVSLAFLLTRLFAGCRPVMSPGAAVESR